MSILKHAYRENLQSFLLVVSKAKKEKYQVFRVLPSGGDGWGIPSPTHKNFLNSPHQVSIPLSHKSSFLLNKILISFIFLVDEEQKKKMAQNFFEQFDWKGNILSWPVAFCSNVFKISTFSF